MNRFETRTRLAITLAALVVLGCNCGPPPPAKFSEVQAKVFSASCTFSACHNAASNSGGLVLDPGKAYANLVGVKAVGAPDRIRVVAGDVATSYLYEKLTNAQPAAGVRMPQSSDPLEPDRLQMVKSWIANGAQDD